ncbi:MAG: extracellular solute-binding protein, partial [Clostridia bacterium]|nr:extracellular solute-binding protein [Clostridia bacterium]
MKKIISTILVVTLMFILSAFVLTSCGGPTVAADFVMPEGGFDTETPITIKFYHSMGKNLQDVLNASIEDFNDKYPNITVEHMSYGDYDGVLSQVKTELTVGDHPNLAYGYADHVAVYNISGATQTLDVFINDSTYGFTAEELGNFVKGTLDEGKAFGDGKTYLLPIAKSTEVLYYNKDFFEKHNLTVPTTWAEMEETCKKIKEIEPGCIPLGYDSEANLFITMAEQYKSAYTDGTAENPFAFDNETNRNFVEMFRSWYENKWMTTQELSGGYTSALFTGESDSGTRCYMCIGSTGGAGYQQPNSSTGENGEIKFEFEVGISVLPQVDKANPKVISQGPNVCIFKDNDPQKVLASWLFAKHLATDEMFQAEVSMSNGYVPVIESVRENTVYADFLAKGETEGTKYIQAYAVKVAIEQTNAMFVSDAFYGSAVAREQVGMLIQKCLAYEGADVKAAIKS